MGNELLNELLFEGIYSSLEDVAKIKYGKDFKASTDGQPINAIVTNTTNNTINPKSNCL